MYPIRSIFTCLNNTFLSSTPIASKFYHILITPTIKQLNLSSECIQKPLANLLLPWNPIITQVAGFKVKGVLRRRCKDCYFVMREQRLYNICKTHPRHKQMSMKPRDYKSWILTHATQSKIRPY